MPSSAFKISSEYIVTYGQVRSGKTYTMEGTTKNCRVKYSREYCGICKTAGKRSDMGKWVRCDGCKVWVHAEYDKISSNHFKDLGTKDYYCPDCKVKFNFELSDSDNYQPNLNV